MRADPPHSSVVVLFSDTASTFAHCFTVAFWLTLCGQTSQVSNVFNFIFGITAPRRLDDGSAAVLKRILPSSAEEAARVWRYNPNST